MKKLLTIAVLMVVLVGCRQNNSSTLPDDKEAKAMLANLKVGDNICTIGGIHAKITGIKDDTLYIEVGRQKAELVIARWAVRNVEELSVTNDSENLI